VGLLANGMITRLHEGLYTQNIVCTTLGVDGKVVRKDSFENSFDGLQEYLSQFHEEDAFVM
jgi:hypothetical protein